MVEERAHSAPATEAPLDGRLRAVLAARALVALVLGLVITFVVDHSAAIGLLMLGIFAALSAVLAALDALRRRTLGALWIPVALRAAVHLLVAAVALLAAPAVTTLLVLLAGWAAVTGIAELVEGILLRRRQAGGRDALLIGGATLLLALLVILTPPEFANPWQVTADDGSVEAAGVVTASIVAVGFLGAWGIVTGVLLGISAAGDGRAAHRTSPIGVSS